jgi:hypothetical protein
LFILYVKIYFFWCSCPKGENMEFIFHLKLGSSSRPSYFLTFTLQDTPDIATIDLLQIVGCWDLRVFDIKNGELLTSNLICVNLTFFKFWFVFNTLYIFRISEVLINEKFCRVLMNGKQCNFAFDPKFWGMFITTC